MKNKQLLKELRKVILREFGKRCQEYGYGCVNCDAHMALECLEVLIGDKEM